MARTIALAVLGIALAVVAWTFATPGASMLPPHPTRAAEAYAPSRSGFAASNLTPEGVTGLRALLGGRCGGLVYASLDYHRAGRRPPREEPRLYVWQRTVVSLLDNVPRFVRWNLLPDEETWWAGPGAGQRTRETELPRLESLLRRGPVPLGLVRASRLRDIALDHQVVAYAVERDGRMAYVHVYDPDQPLLDDVVLDVDLSDPTAPVVERQGDFVTAEWRGFFVERYAPAAPPE